MLGEMPLPGSWDCLLYSSSSSSSSKLLLAGITHSTLGRCFGIGFPQGKEQKGSQGQSQQTAFGCGGEALCFGRVTISWPPGLECTAPSAALIFDLAWLLA